VIHPAVGVVTLMTTEAPEPHLPPPLSGLLPQPSFRPRASTVPVTLQTELFWVYKGLRDLESAAETGHQATFQATRVAQALLTEVSLPSQFHHSINCLSCAAARLFLALPQEVVWEDGSSFCGLPSAAPSGAPAGVDRDTAVVPTADTRAETTVPVFEEQKTPRDDFFVIVAVCGLHLSVPGDWVPVLAVHDLVPPVLAAMEPWEVGLLPMMQAGAVREVDNQEKESPVFVDATFYHGWISRTGEELLPARLTPSPGLQGVNERICDDEAKRTEAKRTGRATQGRSLAGWCAAVRCWLLIAGVRKERGLTSSPPSDPPHLNGPCPQRWVDFCKSPPVSNTKQILVDRVDVRDAVRASQEGEPEQCMLASIPAQKNQVEALVARISDARKALLLPAAIQRSVLALWSGRRGRTSEEQMLSHARLPTLSGSVDHHRLACVWAEREEVKARLRAAKQRLEAEFRGLQNEAPLAGHELVDPANTTFDALKGVVEAGRIMLTSLENSEAGQQSILSAKRLLILAEWRLALKTLSTWDPTLEPCAKPDTFSNRLKRALREGEAFADTALDTPKRRKVV